MRSTAAHRPRRRRALLDSALLDPAWLASTLAALFLAAGCRTIPTVPGAGVEVLYQGTLAEARPVDIVVAPIENTSKSSEVPVKALRDAFVRGLVKRRYSPLSLEYVDRQVMEAAYTPGSLREDAVLQVEVLRWDTSLWESQGSIGVTLEAWMLDASQPGRAELWGGRLEERLHLDQELSSFGTQTALFEEVSEQIASKLLEAMPARPAAP